MPVDTPNIPQTSLEQVPDPALRDAGSVGASRSAEQLEKSLPSTDATGPGPRALHVSVVEKLAASHGDAAAGSAHPAGVSPTSVQKSSRSSKKKAQVKQYSRYNRRYLDREQLRRETAQTQGSVAVVSASRSGFALRSDDGLAFSWLPFFAYGGAAVLLVVLWCVLTRVLTEGTPLPGDASLTAGLILLCVIVAGGLALMGTSVKLTLDQSGGCDAVDVWAAAVGRTAVAMVTAIVVWVACMAVATL